MRTPNIFRRTRAERRLEQTNEYVSKHRKRVTISKGAPGGDVTKRVELFSVHMNVTKTPPWVKRRKNRARNKAARKSRRANQRNSR